MTDSKNAYLSDARYRLELISARIVALGAKADEKRGNEREELKATLNDLRASKDRAERQLQELRLASQPAWDRAKQGVEHACDSLIDAVKTARERFQ